LRDDDRKDSEQYGDWLVKKAESKYFVTVSTQRAFDFLLQKLKLDDKVSLRDRFIENRQGKVLT
jgi:hypothetical protein